MADGGSTEQSEGRSAQPVKTYMEKQREAKTRARRKEAVVNTLAGGAYLAGEIFGGAAVDAAQNISQTIGEHLQKQTSAVVQEVSGMPSEEAHKRQVVETKPSTENSNWRQVYIVKKGDTISGIAKSVYPDFDKNQPFYIQLLRQANSQEPKENTLLQIGQEIYAPDPKKPAYGLKTGEEIKPISVKGENSPTKLLGIVQDPEDPTKHLIEIGYLDGKIQIPAKVGEEFATDRHFQVAEIFEPRPGVSQRVVVEDLGKARE